MSKIWITKAELKKLVREMFEMESQVCEKCGELMESCKCEVEEVAPPGREKQVKGIKKHMKKGDIPKTYVDKTGKRKESNPWALAWAQYNKE